MGDGFFDKFKTVIGLESEEIEAEIELEERPKKKKLFSKEQNEPNIQKVQRDTYSYRSNIANQDKRDIGGKVVNINGNINQMKVVLLQPTSIEECPKIVDNLKSKKPVIVNLSSLDSDTARKIFDFISGAVYALEGNVQKVANNIFIFAPENVDVTGNLEEGNLLFNTSEFKNWR